MKNNILEYRGYYAALEFSVEDCAIIGKVIGLNDTLAFDCDSSDKVEQEFHNLIDDYIETCVRLGKEPDKSYKGSFNIRISPELHRKAALKAFSENISLNEFVEEAIQRNVVEYYTVEKEFSKVLKEYQTMIKSISGKAQYSQKNYLGEKPYTVSTLLARGSQLWS